MNPRSFRPKYEISREVAEIRMETEAALVAQSWIEPFYGDMQKPQIQALRITFHGKADLAT
jgi:hypothetical protein